MKIKWHAVDNLINELLKFVELDMSKPTVQVQEQKSWKSRKIMKPDCFSSVLKVFL